MIEIQTPNDIKQSLIVKAAAVCTTILQTQRRWTLLTLLAFSITACGPGGTTNHNQYITSQGSDKKLPDDDGYNGGGGTGDGGGGQGILCSPDTKNPEYRSKLFVRDIFEGFHNSKLKMKQVPGPAGEGSEKVSPESIRFLIASLKSFFGPSLQQLEIGREKFWLDFVSRISFLEEDTRLHPSQDANSPIALPNGCKIVQIAYWDDSTGKAENGTLYVDRSLWTKLDSLNKITLLAHEYFFKEARKAGYKNSDMVRTRLAQLFLASRIKPLFPESGVVNRYCTGTNKSDINSAIHFYQVIAKDPSREYLVVPFFSSSNIGISSLEGRSFILNNDFVANAFENIILNSNQTIEMSIYQPKLPETLWSGNFSTSTSSIKLSLKNPFVIANPREHVISKTDVPLRILDLITVHMKRAAYELIGADKTIDDDQILRAYIVLENEIASNLKDGIYLSTFPRWQGELDKLGLKITTGKSKRLLESFGINGTYPRLLYKFRAGLLSENQIRGLFSDDYSFSKDTYLVKGLATAEKENQSIEFDIKCYDRDTINVSQRENNLLNGPPIRGPKDQVPYNIDYAKFMAAHESTDENKFRSKIEMMLRRALYVDYPEQSEFQTDTAHSCSLLTIDGCSAEVRLGYKLARTKSVNIHRCFDYSLKFDARFEVANDELTDNRCLIIEIPEEKTYYLMTESEKRDPQVPHPNIKNTIHVVSKPTYPDLHRESDPGP